MDNERLDSITAAVLAGTACKQAAERIKSASGFEYIGEVPGMGGHFASHKLENDYQIKHPVISTLHPGIYGGAAIGAALSKSRLSGAVLGGTIGMAAEAGHRLNYLMRARQLLGQGKDPTDPRYRI